MNLNILHLVKKDYLLVKKQILLMVLVIIAVPILYLSKLDVVNNSIESAIIVLVVVFVVIMLLPSSVSLVELNSKKGLNFLCIVPYTRTQIVLSKYLFDLCVFGVCFIFLLIVNLIYPSGSVKLSGIVIALTYLLTSIYRGIIIPVEYKYGYEKSKYISTFSIVLMPILISSISQNSACVKVISKIGRLFNGNGLMDIIVVFAIAIVINIVSFTLANRIFKNKEF